MPRLQNHISLKSTTRQHNRKKLEIFNNHKRKMNQRANQLVRHREVCQCLPCDRCYLHQYLYQLLSVHQIRIIVHVSSRRKTSTRNTVDYYKTKRKEYQNLNHSRDKTTCVEQNLVRWLMECLRFKSKLRFFVRQKKQLSQTAKFCPKQQKVKRVQSIMVILGKVIRHH